LGPVLVSGTRAGRPSSPLTRTVVGLLAVAGEAGLSDLAIADLVWGMDTVPASRLNVAVHRTRDWLERHTEGRVRIDRTTTGYALRGAEVDAHRFTGLLRGSPGEPDLVAALALWRGTPLADAVALGELEPLVAPLRERHRAAVLGYARILLASDRATDAVGLLTPVADDAPMDEQVHALLLTALAASGRQAEALTRYDRLRGRLADELGVDPGPELSGAMVRVLRGKLPYGGAGPERATPAPVAVRPAQLTPDVTSFTGRGGPLAALDALAGTSGRGQRVALVTGVGGVGKTALAVHWAHGRAAGRPTARRPARLFARQGGDPRGRVGPVPARPRCGAVGVARRSGRERDAVPVADGAPADARRAGQRRGRRAGAAAAARRFRRDGCGDQQGPAGRAGGAGGCRQGRARRVRPGRVGGTAGRGRRCPAGGGRTGRGG
jgi:hypothetical protein